MTSLQWETLTARIVGAHNRAENLATRETDEDMTDDDKFMTEEQFKEFIQGDDCYETFACGCDYERDGDTCVCRKPTTKGGNLCADCADHHHAFTRAPQ